VSNRPTRRPFDGRTDERTPRRAAAPRKPRTESAFVVVVRSFVRSFVVKARTPRRTRRLSFVRRSSFVVVRRQSTHTHRASTRRRRQRTRHESVQPQNRRWGASYVVVVVVSRRRRRRHRVASLVHDDTSCPRWSSSSTVRAAPPPIRFIASSTTDEAKGACVPTAHAGVAHVWICRSWMVTNLLSLVLFRRESRA